MYDHNNELIVSNYSKSKEINDIEKALIKLKNQEKKLVDLYISSNLNIDTINAKNDMIKKEILKLEEKKKLIDPDDSNKEYTLELIKKLDCKLENDEIIFHNKLALSFNWDSLNRKTKKEILNRLIKNIEITREKNYNIEIKNITFTDEFISKSTKEYLNYLNEILQNNSIGITYKKLIDEEKLKNLSKNYYVLSLIKLENNGYSDEEINFFSELIQEHFYCDGIIECPYLNRNDDIDRILLIPKTKIIN